jgi:hypothetical protein
MVRDEATLADAASRIAARRAAMSVTPATPP